MKFEVITRVFGVGTYILKKGDVIEIVEGSLLMDGTVAIDNEYFEFPQITNMRRIESHCEKR